MSPPRPGSLGTVQMLNALTIDLEDWYQGLTSTARQVERWPDFEDRVAQSTERLLAILSRASVKATFFVLGFVADEFPGLVQRVAEAGHEIALHGYHHRQVSQLTPEQFRDDILRGCDAVEQACGQRPMGYRAPMFSITRTTLWALTTLRDLGFGYDSSLFPTRNMLYGFPGAPRFPYYPFEGSSFAEFPLSTLRLAGTNWPVAGGFYFRVIPYPLFRWALRRLNHQGHPAIFYLHPWELDPGQPRPHPSPRERLTHYSNLGRTEGKLIALLRDFRFGPLIDQLPLLVQGARA